MPLNLIKLSVGITDIDHLKAVQTRRLRVSGQLRHVTRNRPRRADELLDGGSIYWVIKGVIQARQALLDITDAEDETGKPACALVLSPDLVTVEPRRFRPFQGWRYFDADQAPPDLGATHPTDLPEEMAAELRELGLL